MSRAVSKDFADVKNTAWVVELKNNNTEASSFRCDDPGRECNESCGEITSTVEKMHFQSEEAAMEQYNRWKSMLRFAGSSGMYVTYPVKVVE